MDLEERVMEAAADTAQVEFPPVLVEMEIDRLLSQRIRRWQRGGDGLEEYLKSIDKTEEEIREELRPLATKQTNWSLVLGEIAEKEKIKVNKPEIDAEIKNISKGAAGDKKGELRKMLDTPQSRRSITQTLLTRKTIQRLMEIAKGSDMSNETSKKEGQK